MASILVVDDEPVIREPLAASLAVHGHKVVCACDGHAAKAALKSHLPDLILLDIQMPVMDGIAFLRDLRANPATAALPVLLLSNSTDKEMILKAAKLNVQGYILKSAFSMDELLDRIRRIQQTSSSPAAAAGSPPLNVAAASSDSHAASSDAEHSSKPASSDPSCPKTTDWPKILTREQSLSRLDQIASGKTIAGVVAQLMSVANSPSADLADVVRVIQSDPILASRVLHLANAASTGSRTRARTVDDAARNLGVRGVQNMAISIGIFGAFPPDERDGFNTMRCWQHSYAVADLLNVLLRERNPEQESMNHLIGLCHDLGEILLRQHFADEYGQVLAFAVAHRLSVHQVESVALGIRHPELVSRLLTRMGLPALAVQGIREFYEREIRHQAAGLGAQTQALSWANFAANGLLLAASVHEEVRPITSSEWKQFISSKPPALDPALTRNNILTSTNVLAALPEQQAQRLLMPPIPRCEKRICYVRPSSFIEFDPLAFALALCGNLTITENLPEASAWRDIDALVMVGLRPGAQGIVPEELAARAAAAGRPDLPILCLVAQEIPITPHGAILVRSYPISLDDIGQWLTAGVTAPATA